MRPLLLAGLLVSAASAQPSNWDLPTSGRTVSLAVGRPFFSEGNPFEGATSVWSLSTTQPVGPLVRIVGDLPFAYAKARGETSTALGNLQVGVEADLPASPVTLGGYLRLPTASDSDEASTAQFMGLFADYERLGSYVSDVVTVSALAEGRLPVGTAPGLTVRLRALPQVFIPTSDATAGLSFEDPEATLGYAAQVLFDPPLSPLRVGGGLSGITTLTESGGGLGDRSQLFAGVMADAALGAFRPGVMVWLPLGGDLDRSLNGVVGLRLGVVFD